MIKSKTLYLSQIAFLLLMLMGAASANAALPRFVVTFTAPVQSQPFTGRIVIYTAPKTDVQEPRFGPNWFQPQPMFAVDVKNKRPGDTIVVGEPGTITFPAGLREMGAGEFVAQAVLDKNNGEREIGTGAGNGYSAPVLIASSGVTHLLINKIVPEPVFKETEHVKEVSIESALLTRFYHRPTRLRAAIVLPDNFDKEPARKYPILYIIPGFGGRHYNAERFASILYPGPKNIPLLRVLLDPDCPTGHSVFADSANNGPRGEALIKELIPYIEKRYRAIGTTETRLVTGHSSGGWSSLYLQVAYPETFGGVWSTSPDPVDFRDFQRINLYAKNANMFTDEQGKPRPLARQGTTPVIFYKQFSDMERPLGHGEQLGSFEGVFSPRLPNGLPRPLWDRTTGAVDPVTAHAWEKYDIRLLLTRNWGSLAPKLRGKLHIYTGELDTFYLEGAVKLLKADIATLGSDAIVEIEPGKDHGTLLDVPMLKRIAREMGETLARAKVPSAP